MKPVVNCTCSRFQVWKRGVVKLIFILVLLGIKISISQTIYNVGKYRLLYQDEKYFDITTADTIGVTTDYLLITLRENITEIEREDFNSRYPISVAHTTCFGVIRYLINEQEHFIDLLEDISTDEDVKLYDINHLIPLADPEIGQPNDSYDEIYSLMFQLYPHLLWPYEKTNLFEAWNITTGSPDITVAVIDNGLWIEHPDIGQGQDDYSNIWDNEEELKYGIDGYDDDGCGKADDFHGWNFTLGNYDLTNYYDKTHGMRMSGIIAAKTNNEIGVWGTAGGYSTLGVKIMMLNCGINEGDDELLNSALIPEAIEYAVCQGVRIINMSFGGIFYDGNWVEVINDAYEFHNTIFVSGTGNIIENGNVVNFPANLDNVIAVAATQCNPANEDQTEFRWETEENISQSGPEVEIAAPAAYIIADAQWFDDHYEPVYNYLTDKYQGSTSKATAFVSGVIALMLSEYPCLSNDEVREILRETDDKIEIDGFPYDPQTGHSLAVGYGRINALAALHPDLYEPITTTKTWTTNRKVFQDLYIENQGELTIDNCTISMAKGTKIIVEQGGRLTLQNGAILTGLCDQTWQGIEVWGNKNASQYTSGAQGKLIVNGATIENAVTAVELWKPGEGATSGGIIYATDALFLNNSRSIHAIDYKNHLPGSLAETDNFSNFTNCTFSIDDQYIGDKTFYKHVDLDRVRGIKFYGCTFSLDHTATNISQWNSGIAAYNAGFKVLPHCPSHTVPCPNYDSCRFDGFYWAVAAYNNSVNPVQITNAHFDDNVTGIYLSSADYSIILENFFEVGFDNGFYGTCGFANGIGIDIHSSIGFAIENNKFRKNLQAPRGIYAGIRAYWCPTPYDLIYKNEFRGLSYGNYAEGRNRFHPLVSNEGIEYQCNQNFNNIEDFRVTAEHSEDAMVRGTHGNRDIASGNRFSRSTSPDNWDFWYGGTQIINWYYCEAPCIDEKPVRIHEEEEEYFVEIESPESNDCPDHYGGSGHINLSGGEKFQKETCFTLNQSDYNSVKNLYESLKDGGSTQSELNDIQAAEQDDMWDLRSQLLGHSPHLSQDVLRAVSNRNDIFPDNILLEILASNPDELNRDTLLRYLEQKENPLPNYMIEILKQTIGGVTYKTILLDELAKYHANKYLAAQDIIRSVLYDTLLNSTEFRNWLDNIGGIEADKHIISSYLQEKDTASAITLLNLLPALYELEGEELEDYSNYKTLIDMEIDNIAEEKTLFELDSLEIGILEEIASEGKTESGNQARNMLTYAFNYQYCDCMEFTDSTQLKSYHASISNTSVQNFGLRITAIPNPADSWVAINYELPLNETRGEIQIADITGKVTFSIALRRNVGQEVWDTRNIDPGLYFVTLLSSGLTLSIKLVIL